MRSYRMRASKHESYSLDDSRQKRTRRTHLPSGIQLIVAYVLTGTVPALFYCTRLSSWTANAKQTNIA